MCEYRHQKVLEFKQKIQKWNWFII